jgi:hypothetical protein
VKPSEWESWLQGFEWVLPGAVRLAENFPLVVEHLLVPAEFRKRVLLDLMRPVNGISAGYKMLADFVLRGLIRTVFTTNFDTCLPDALRERQPHIRHIHEVNRGPGDYDQFNVYSKCQIIWLHGRAEQYSDKNSAGEVGTLDQGLLSLIRPMLNASPIIVVGYRGSEPSIMEGLFGQNKEGRLDFPNGVYWCTRHIQTSKHSRGAWVRISACSGLMDLTSFSRTSRRKSLGMTAMPRLELAAGRSATFRLSTSASRSRLRSTIWISTWRCQSCANIAKNLDARR